MMTWLRCVALVSGPALMAASTFYWEDGRYGVTGGVLVAFSAIAWIYGILGIWEHLYVDRPRLSVLGIVLSLAGCFGGMAFGMQGFFEAIFGASPQESLDAAAAHPVASGLVLWYTGPAFPASLVLLGLVLARAKAVPMWMAVLLAASGAAFPLSRIARIDLVAHAADLAMLVSFCGLAVLVARGALGPKPALGPDDGARSGPRRTVS